MFMFILCYYVLLGLYMSVSLSIFIGVLCEFFLVFFFFKQKTAYEMRISDWSSDVCSSDLRRGPPSVYAGVPSCLWRHLHALADHGFPDAEPPVPAQRRDRKSVV